MLETRTIGWLLGYITWRVTICCPLLCTMHRGVRSVDYIANTFVHAEFRRCDWSVISNNTWLWAERCQ